MKHSEASGWWHRPKAQSDVCLNSFMSVGMVTMYMKWKRTSTRTTAPRCTAPCTLMFHISRSFLLMSDLFTCRGQHTLIKAASFKNCSLVSVTRTLMGFNLSFQSMDTFEHDFNNGGFFICRKVNNKNRKDWKYLWRQLWRNPWDCRAEPDERRGSQVSELQGACWLDVLLLLFVF